LAAEYIQKILNGNLPVPQRLAAVLFGFHRTPTSGPLRRIARMSAEFRGRVSQRAGRRLSD